MTESDWPKPLVPVQGPFSGPRLAGAAAGMGDAGPATCELAAAGFVPPDLITGMTLFLLARQKRQATASPTKATEDGGERSSGTPITGGVWVREQFVIHRPLATSDAFTVTGESTGRYVRKGRRYGTTRSVTTGEDGTAVATNLTTGLLSYHVEPGAEDEVIGLPLAETPGPDPDHGAAADNPHLTALRAATVGQVLGGAAVTVSLAMMADRDTSNPDNAIHSDPEQAKKAGLERPIAGGSHVLSFALEPMLATFGLHALNHGTHFDVRWRAPTHCDVVITPTVMVTAAEADRLVLDLTVTLADGPAAMVGTVTIPLAVR
ncbi:MAG: MaoC family dehydratase [Actinomycetota bacterium]